MATPVSYSAFQSNTSQTSKRVFKGKSGVNFYHKEGRFVMISGVDSDNKGTVDIADAKTDKSIGVIVAGYATSKTTPDDVTVIMLNHPGTIRVLAGSAITAGDSIAPDETATDGTAQTAVATQFPAGIALNTAAAADLVEFLPTPGANVV